MRWMLDKIPQPKKCVEPKYHSPPLSEVSDNEDNNSTLGDEVEPQLLEMESYLLSPPTAEDSSSNSEMSVSSPEVYYYLYEYHKPKENASAR